MRIKSYLSIFTLVFIAILSLLRPSIAHAADVSDATQEMLRIYCERRDSTNVSLEQWYGGKCTSDNPAELIGFGDIVVLDLMEKLGGGNGQEIDLNAFIQQLLGQSPTPLNSGFAVLGFRGKEVGAIQSIGAITGSMLVNPPASSVEYIAQVRDNINRHNPVAPAYAQTATGFGFESLRLVLPLWTAFRNLTYLIFTLVFVVYGFMIMLRVKISAQAVTTIQLALPRIITTLLAITFSYAIAGLLIDLFYVIVGLIMNALASPAVKIIVDKANAEWVSGLSSGLWGPFSTMVLHIITWSLSGKILGAIIPAGWAAGITQFALNVTLGTIMNIILLIAVLIVSIKIFWTLLQANVRLILKIMFSPLLLIMNIFPSSKAISEWIKGIIAELSVFATTMILFVLSFYFIGPITFQSISVNPTSIDFNGNVSTGLLQVGDLPTGRMFSPPPFFNAVAAQDEQGKLALVGLGIFLMIPKLAETVRSKFEKDSLFVFGKDLGDSLGGGFKAAYAPLKYRNEQRKKELEGGSRPAGTSPS